MDIPKDFDSKWELSDVVLISEDAEGNEKELHANKAYLATFSSVLKTMFFSSFAEANSESVKVSCDYETMMLILQIIYRQSHSFSNANQPLNIGVLPKLYKAADYLDIPAIREMCIQQMASRSCLEMATAVLGIATIGDDLHDTLMRILEKLNPDDIKKFLSTEDSQPLFTKNDVKRIFMWITFKILPAPTEVYAAWFTTRFITDLSKNCKNVSVDCTQKWPRSDVLIKTKNSDGKELYSNKTVLSMVSSHFADLFFVSPNKETTATNLAEIEVDVDYMIMKNILTIVHQCFDICKLPMSAFVIYNMYSISKRENMDIPIIRSICVKKLMDWMDDCGWEMATSFKLDVDERLLIVKKMSAENIRCWLFDFSVTDSPDLFSNYDDPKNYKMNFTSETKPIVSTTEVGIMIEKLLIEYNKSL